MTSRIIKNTGTLTVASIMQKIISFAYFTAIARIIGVSHTGNYFTAIAFTTVFTVVADFGLGSVLTREAAKEPSALVKYVQNIFSLKLIFGTISYALCLGASTYFTTNPDLRVLIAISGLTMFLDNLQTAFYSGFRSQQNLAYEAAGNIISQLLTLIIGSLALFLKAPLYWLILAYTIPSGLMNIYAASMLRKVYGVSVRLVYDIAWIKKILVIALPFAAASIIGRLYSYADVFIMTKLLSAESIGWWSVPFKNVYAFQFVATALSISLYPAFSSLYKKDPASIARLYTQSLKYLALFAVPLAVGLYTLAFPLIHFLYTDAYLPSTVVLQILSLSLLGTYTSFVTGALLNATDRQKTQTALIAGALVLNILLDLILIPRLSIFGTALSDLCASLLLMVGGLLAARRALQVPLTTLTRPLTIFLVPGFGMGIVCAALVTRTSFLVAGIAGGCLYLALVLAMRIVTIEEIRSSLAPHTTTNI